jgi:hypothetical protein
VRAWISAGRADLNTKAKELGTDDWKTLGDFPEFAEGGLGSGNRTAAGPAAADTGQSAELIAGRLIARAGKLDVFGCYDRSWKLLKAHFWPLLGVTVLLMLISGAGGMVPVLGIVVSLTLGGVFAGGLQFFFLKKFRGQEAGIVDAFAGFNLAFGPLVVASLLVVLITATGFVLLILPGIYLAVAYQFTYLLVLDKKLDFWTAMEVSRRVVTAQWWRMFGLVLLSIPFGLLGLVCLIVGIFPALVLIQGATISAYEDLCNPKE